MTPWRLGARGHGAPAAQSAQPDPAGTVLGVVRAGLVLASLLVLVFAACGGDGKETAVRSTVTHPPRTGTTPVTTTTRASHRYAPGDPQCDARRRPGTVGDIGEDVVGLNAPVRSFVACFGPPVAVKREGARRCLYYKMRSTRLFWELCAADGKIVSAVGSRSKGDLP